MTATKAKITERKNGLFDVTAEVGGFTVTLGQEIHDPEVAKRIARHWELGNEMPLGGAKSETTTEQGA